MLNGVEPLIIITLKNKGILDFFGPDSLIGSVVDAIGLPIPIYLSERLTGIYIDNESRSIDVNTEVNALTEMDPLTAERKDPDVKQTAVDSHLTINLLASKDSIILTAFVALMDLIVKRLVSQEYEIHYLNGPSVIFGARLARFASHVEHNTDLIRMELTLSTASKASNPTPKTPIPALEKVTGSIPL